MVSANRKMGQKRVKRGSKRLENGYFGPFLTIFQRFSTNVDCGSYFEIQCTMCGVAVFQKKIGVGILRSEGSKSGIFETFPETPGIKVWVAGSLSLPDPGFDHLFGDFQGSAHPPPSSKNLDVAPISEKSWESPNFCVPDQNPASPRSGWTSWGSEQKSKIGFLRLKPESSKKELFSVLF